MNDKNFWKILLTLKLYKHIAMYPCTKFQSIWRISDFGTKVAPKKYEWQNFEKKNIKFEIKT